MSKRTVSKSLAAQLMMLAITLSGLYYVGFQVLGGSAVSGPVHLTVKAPTSGGTYPKSEVTYRGIRVGTVKEVQTFPDHVEVEIVVGEDADIPEDTEVALTYLSPIGENLVEFRPRSSGPPYLEDGDVIEGSDVSMAEQFSETLTMANKLLTDINPDDIRTLVDEAAIAFDGNSLDLAGILDDGDQVLANLEKLSPKIERILRNSRRPLATLNAQAPNLTRFARAAAQISAQMKASSGDIGSLIDDGLVTTRVVNQLLDRYSDEFNELMATTAVLVGRLSPHFPGLRALLQAYPAAMRTMVEVLGGAQVNAVGVPNGPRLCNYDQKRRDPWDIRNLPLYNNSACPNPDGTLERGWQNANGG